MVRSSTDLPLPEPPTMPNTSPARMSASRPSCTTWAPNRFTMPRTAMIGVHQMSSSMKITANTASARITRKIDCTTAAVVSRPSSREEVAHLHAAQRSDQRDQDREHRAP